MAYQDDPTGADSMRELVKRIRRLEAGSPLGNSSISKGSLRIASEEGLIVEGSASVTGVLKGLGQLLWNGIVTLTSTFTAKGVTRFEGDTTQVGPFHITGATDVTGLLTVNGNADFNGIVNIDGPLGVNGLSYLRGTTEVSGDLTVVAGGIITVGAGLTLEPLGAGGGAINFQPTGSISASIGRIVMISPDGTASLVVGNSGVSITLTSISATGKTPNVWADANGKLWRLGS